MIMSSRASFASNAASRATEVATSALRFADRAEFNPCDGLNDFGSSRDHKERVAEPVGLIVEVFIVEVLIVEVSRTLKSELLKFEVAGSSFFSVESLEKREEIFESKDDNADADVPFGGEEPRPPLDPKDPKSDDMAANLKYHAM
mmetsp:Transcript_112167/g.203874  ORF Transcript_112167/g.203874 Transcript_112167/m.203874 type:complete len:145 (+) Transcript_112167:3159-3593(+)